MSRDDSGTFIPDYTEAEIIKQHPFASIEQTGVGQLVKLPVLVVTPTRPDAILVAAPGNRGGRSASTRMPTALDGEQWMAVLERLAQALPSDGSLVRLCLIGSAACLFGGMEGRASLGLDIWKPASDYDRLELARAAKAAGLLFDPKTTLEPDTPYLQLVEPGLTQVGEFVPIFIERLGRLHLLRPPVEHLVAAKLIRAEPKDLEDVAFLISRHRPDPQRIRQIVAGFEPVARERATENLVYLDVLKPAP